MATLINFLISLKQRSFIGWIYTLTNEFNKNTLFHRLTYYNSQRLDTTPRNGVHANHPDDWQSSQHLSGPIE